MADAAKPEARMPLLVERYLLDTTHLTTEQHGAYMLLLIEGWKRGGVLPQDDAQLAAVSRMAPGRWRTLGKPVLMPFFRSDGRGGLVQKRLMLELERAQHLSVVRSKASKSRSKPGSIDPDLLPETASKTPAKPPNLLPKKAAKAQQMGGRGGSPPSAPTPGPRVSSLRSETQEDPASAGSSRARTRERVDEAIEAMRDAGMADVSPGNPTLMAAVEQGMTAGELADAARVAVGQGKGFAWALKRAIGQREDAARLALAPPAPARAGSMADYQQQLAALKGQA